MADKLSPIPPNGTRKKTWNDLNNLLQSNFKTDTYREHRTAAINSDDFEMSIDDIVQETEKQGYKTKVDKHGYITFTD